jgi:hypothetical protein
MRTLVEKIAHRRVRTMSLNTHQKSGKTANFRNSEGYRTGRRITTGRPGRIEKQQADDSRSGCVNQSHKAGITLPRSSDGS